MKEPFMILGREAAYWMELERRFHDGCASDADTLLNEIVALRSKVSFYESRIKQMVRLMGKDDQ